VSKRKWLALAALLLTGLIALSLTGCGKQERSQAGADAAAGLKALRTKLATMEAGYATAEALAILSGIEKYIPAATGVNPSEWPDARISPTLIAQMPQLYADSAPPIPPLAPVIPWDAILQVALGVLGVGGLGGAGVAMRVVGKTRTALRIACDLADQNANAETDADVERNKMVAAQQQMAAGVQSLTQNVRGKN